MDHLPELSNFYACVPLVYNGEEYRTSEHLYQAMKFSYFDTGANPAYADFVAEIRAQRTPYKAKVLASCRQGGKYAWQVKLGERAKTYTARGVKLHERWNDVRVSIMENILRYKFWCDAKCRAALMATGNAELVERTDTDDFWGDGRDRKGANMLGKLLVKIRNEWQTKGVSYKMPPFIKGESSE